MGSMQVPCDLSVGSSSLTSPSLDNVDYNELKHLIKVNTTRGQGRAVPIPGHADGALQKFENLFYAELWSQHDRVDLFVKSKADEISRRLCESPPPSLG
jgi:site-specific recombinase XerD